MTGVCRPVQGHSNSRLHVVMHTVNVQDSTGQNCVITPKGCRLTCLRSGVIIPLFCAAPRPALNACVNSCRSCAQTHTCGNHDSPVARRRAGRRHPGTLTRVPLPSASNLWKASAALYSSCTEPRHHQLPASAHASVRRRQPAADARSASAHPLAAAVLCTTSWRTGLDAPNHGGAARKRRPRRVVLASRSQALRRPRRVPRWSSSATRGIGLRVSFASKKIAPMLLTKESVPIYLRVTAATNH